MSLELPREVTIRDVSPRDGLQAEPRVLSTDDKLLLIDGLARAGVPRIEATSFVNPQLLPQLADLVRKGLEIEAGRRGVDGLECHALDLVEQGIHLAERRCPNLQACQDICLAVLFS